MKQKTAAKRRAVLLSALFALALLAACGAASAKNAAPTPEPAPENPLLPYGDYAVRRESDGAEGGVIGYLTVAAEALTFYDARGTVLVSALYAFGEDGVITAGGEPLYTVTAEDGAPRLTSVNGTIYLLNPAEGEIPLPAAA